MIGWTLCSGIGAPEVAAPWVDWRLASEIEPFPRAVLQERFGYRLPEDHNQGDPLLWGDMTEVTPDLARRHGVPLPDLIVAGTPCQAFSVAGLRGGTDDARGNLTLKFVETCHAIVASRPDGKLAVLWENVPGVLSDKGNAFGCFLGGLVGAVDALSAPGDGSWPSEGMVQGPRARAAWCVLDAKWFGVAQRRRRVFVVVDFGNCVDPAAILLEPDRLRGDHPPRREAGQDVAGTLSARTQGGGGLGTDFDLAGGLVPDRKWPVDVSPTLRAGGNKTGGDRPPGTDVDTCDSLVPVHVEGHHGAIAGTVSSKWSKGSGGPAGDETQNMVAFAAEIAPPITSNPFGDHKSREGLLVAFDCKGTEVQHDASGVSPPLRSMGHNQSHQNAGGHAAIAMGFTTEQTPKWADDLALTLTKQSPTGGGQPQRIAVLGATTHSLTGEGHDASEDGSGRGTPVVAFDPNQVTSKTNRSVPTPEVCHTIPNTTAPPHLCSPVVRRLLPVETARLQGFPDDHCNITYRNKPAADGPQYKAYGNSMAVPVIRWILDRVRVSWEAHQ